MLESVKNWKQFKENIFLPSSTAWNVFKKLYNLLELGNNYDEHSVAGKSYWKVNSRFDTQKIIRF